MPTFRLTPIPSEEGHCFTLVRGDAHLLTTSHAIDLAERMLGLGINNPLHLIDAARHYGEVHVYEPRPG